MKPFSLKGIVATLKDTFKGFSEDKVPKLAGALAYFTLLSIGPLLLVIIYIAGVALGRQAVEGTLHKQLQKMVSDDAALQLQQMIKSAATSNEGTIAAIIGIITLLLAATSVFAEIQDSINTIWHIKLKPKQSWKQMLSNRLTTFGIIASIGFLLVVSMAASAFIEGLGERLSKMIPGVSVVLMYVVTQSITLFISALLFAIVFKILPSAKTRWKDVWPGAIATTILFIVGRFAISFYISKSNFGNTYGAAASLVVLLVWIYYSAVIFYFGAEFTKAYNVRFRDGIHPNQHATSIETNKVLEHKTSA